MPIYLPSKKVHCIIVPLLYVRKLTDPCKVDKNVNYKNTKILHSKNLSQTFI